MSENYLGSSISEICKGQDRWSFEMPVISNSKEYGMVEFPLGSRISINPNDIDCEHVQMPFSPHNVFPVEETDNKDTLTSRWEIICEVLKKPIRSVSQFQAAIDSYNPLPERVDNRGGGMVKQPLPTFNVLEHLFEKVLADGDSRTFFGNILPKIIKLALRLPEILPESIPLLREKHNKLISLSQLQVSSLLANAFLCTFPWRKNDTYPEVNFLRFYCEDYNYQTSKRPINAKAERVMCLTYYFRKMADSEPEGIITFERIYMSDDEMPKWKMNDNYFDSTKVHITSEDTIKGHGLGFLQVDFVNKNCEFDGVFCAEEEEIKCVICPEVLISVLFVEEMCDTEVIIVRGIERFTDYQGSGDTFRCFRDFEDKTPRDNLGRRQTAVAMIHPARYRAADHQYYQFAFFSELNKFYVAFHSRRTDNLEPVATGNVLCGPKDHPKLKALIQLIVCNATGRDFVYYTCGNEEFKESLYNMYLCLIENKIHVYQLLKILHRFSQEDLAPEELYNFIEESCSQSMGKRIKDKEITKTSPSSDGDDGIPYRQPFLVRKFLDFFPVK